MEHANPVATSEHRLVKIRAEGIDFSYSDRQDDPKVIEDFNLSFYDQEFLCIVGASGCGKSTLLNILAGLLPPTHGKAWLEDQLITRPSPDRAMVFQDDAVFPWYTVRQNVEYGLRRKGASAEEIKETADHYIKLVGLA